MTTGPEAGYYADPSIPGYIRYWDGTQWVPGTSRPAPDLPQQQEQAALQQSVAAQLTQTPAPQPDHPPQREEVAAAQSQVASSVATMIVPSAFGNRGAYGSGWASGGSGSPFDAIPGLYRSTEQEEPEAPDVRVVELASAGSRILARIIDLCIAVVLSLPATVTLLLVAHRHDHAYVEGLRLHAKTTYRTLGMDAMGVGLWAAAVAVVLITAIIIESYRLPRTGQTTGRRVVGVQVVTAGTAEDVTGGAAATRAFLFWLLALIPVVDVLALGGMLWGRPYRQGLHEKVSRTLSIRA